MAQQHGDGFQHINGLVGVLAEKQHHEGGVPGVLGVILLADAVGEIGLAADEFFLVDFTDEVELLGESVVH